LLATTAILALSGAAYAADMPVKAPPPMAPVPYVANWTGFYAGLQIGGASSEPSCTADAVSLDTAVGPCVDFEGAQHTGGLASGSVIGGGKIGADYQWGNVVLGVVGEFDWTSLHGTDTTTATELVNFPNPITGPSVFFPGDSVTASARIDWLASVRGRIGWAFGNFLAYGTGGVAFTQIKTSISFVPGPEDDFPALSGGGTSHKTGGVAGAGFEYMLSPHVSVAGEVLWYGFGSTTVSELCPSSNEFCGGQTFTTTLNHEDIVSGTLGVNWRF
jgi:outer membrane immunogenic protein